MIFLRTPFVTSDTADTGSCYLRYDTMSEAFSNTLTVLAMEHHDLQKCTRQNQGGPGVKKKVPHHNCD